MRLGLFELISLSIPVCAFPETRDSFRKSAVLRIAASAAADFNCSIEFRSGVIGQNCLVARSEAGLFSIKSGS